MSNVKEYKVNATGTPFLWFLGLLFVGLKLTNFITWSWWLVLLPFYGPAVLVFGLLAILAIVVFFTALFAGR